MVGLDEFIAKYDLKLPPLAEFGTFDPRKQHSSTLYASDGILVKNKNRSDNKTVWEFVMLDLVKGILEAYSENLSSPAPKGFIDGNLAMDFLSTLTADYIVRRVAPTETMPINGQNAPMVPYVLEKLGELSRIKELENLAHGDYVLRHVLVDPNGKVCLIDVENAFLASDGEAGQETQKLRGEIKAARNSTAIRHFEAGYNRIEPRKVAEGLLSQIEEKYGIELDFLNRKVKTF